MLNSCSSGSAACGTRGMRNDSCTGRREEAMTIMVPDKKTLILPILLIALGIGWLLSALGVAPQIDWIWAIGLAAVGLLAFIVGGFDKVTVVLGPAFLIASCLSVLRQTGHLKINIEIPILVILVGVLLLIARLPVIPMPKWITEAPTSKPKK